MPDSLQLNSLIQQLKLSGISDSLESRLRQAKDAELPYEELLSMLLQDELDSRDHSSLQRRIIQAKFEEVKTFEGLNLKRYTLKIRHAINDLMTGKFIKEKNHIIIMGPVGTGKTQCPKRLVCWHVKEVKK
jgi:DNA replication protein DnaC